MSRRNRLLMWRLRAIMFSLSISLRQCSSRSWSKTNIRDRFNRCRHLTTMSKTALLWRECQFNLRDRPPLLPLLLLQQLLLSRSSRLLTPLLPASLLSSHTTRHPRRQWLNNQYTRVRYNLTRNLFKQTSFPNINPCRPTNHRSLRSMCNSKTSYQYREEYERSRLIYWLTSCLSELNPPPPQLLLYSNPPTPPWIIGSTISDVVRFRFRLWLLGIYVRHVMFAVELVRSSLIEVQDRVCRSCRLPFVIDICWIVRHPLAL